MKRYRSIFKEEKNLPNMDIDSFVKELMKNRNLKDTFKSYTIDESYENPDGDFNSVIYLEDFITERPSYDFVNHLRRIVNKNEDIIDSNIGRDKYRVVLNITHK
jgi:hypothetical protein